MTNTLHLKIIGNGRPLIMLHGWGWSSDIWQSLVPYLAEEFQLFLIDLPGFGKSPLVTENYDITAISELLCEITPENALWLGWSLGGMMAWYIAIHHPTRVSRLITVASSPKFVSAENWPGVSLPTLDKFSSSLLFNQQKVLQDFLELQLRGSNRHPELLQSLQNQISAVKTSVPALMGGLNLLRDLDLRSQISDITCPALHVFGSHDMLVP
ncbi:MAG: alpha/beta fold hydrolase, partial [Gammaproteobacteria bacterium]